MATLVITIGNDDCVNEGIKTLFVTSADLST